MGNEDTSVGSSLHGTEDTVSSRGAPESDIEEALEGPRRVLVELLGENELTIGLSDTLVLVGEAELGKSPTSAEETGSVGWRRESLGMEGRTSRKAATRASWRTYQQTSW